MVVVYKGIDLLLLASVGLKVPNRKLFALHSVINTFAQRMNF